MNGKEFSGVVVNSVHPGLVATNLLVVGGFTSPTAIPVGDGAKVRQTIMDSTN